MHKTIKDEDRYIWLLAHMGLVEEEVKKWNPKQDKPLLRHLQDFIDREMPKSGKGWIEEQRALLNKD